MCSSPSVSTPPLKSHAEMVANFHPDDASHPSHLWQKGEKVNISLVQYTLNDGSRKVMFVNWADIVMRFGQFLYLDERDRLKTSVFADHPNAQLNEVVFIQPDTGMYPRRWHHTERPNLAPLTLRLRSMWIAALKSRSDAPIVEPCHRCGQFAGDGWQCCLCLNVYHSDCSRIIVGAAPPVGLDEILIGVKLPSVFQRKLMCAVCRQMCCSLVSG